jgi:hypothetical protein
MTEKNGTRLRAPADLRRYIAKLLCKIEKLPDNEQAEKAGAVSKLADSWLRAWDKEMENERIRKLEMEINALKGGKPGEGASEAQKPPAEDQ